MANPNTITYRRHQDIQIDDVNIRTQFQNYMMVGQYQQAINLLATNSAQLDSKAYVANIINTIVTGVLTLENYFNTGVTVFLSSLATHYQFLIDNLKHMQEWNNAIEYHTYNFVVYNEQVYMALQDAPVGTLPTNTTYWLYLGLRGEDGAPGVDLTMEYNWDSNTIYQPNDLVVYNDAIYVNLTSISGPGTDPINNPDAWLLFLQPVKTGIAIGTNAPEGIVGNQVWFRTQSDPLTATTTDPIIGTFFRYVQETDVWEEMYPGTLFTIIDDADEYVPVMHYEERTLQTTDWINDTYSFTNGLIGQYTEVHILPIVPMNSAAERFYNLMTITISGTTVTLSITETPTVPIGIRIIIQ